MKKRIYKYKTEKVNVSYSSGNESSEYQPTQLDYYQLWLDNITDEERREFINIEQSKAFFNKPFTDINWEEECIKKGFTLQYINTK
jgi:hypothetical protein